MSAHAYISAHTSSEKITRIINLVFRVALVIVTLIAAYRQNWSVVFASLGTLSLTYVPQVIANQVKVRLPLQFELIIILFLYGSIFLGEVGDYYERFWWWDTFLHGGSAFAFGFAGFLILYLLFVRNKLKASPFMVSIFAFAFALAIGALWEIFEFTVDSLFGTSMQKSGLPDTMGDLIIDSVGAGVASTVGFIYLKYDVRDPFDALINWFLKENPRFKPRRSILKRQK